MNNQALTHHESNCPLAEMGKKIYSMEEEIRQLNSALARFVPPQFLELLQCDSIAGLNSGDRVQKEMSILFSDLRAFTSLSETMTPQESFDFVNSYFAKMEPLILRNGGFVDKYIGDAIMALFGQSPDEAILAGIEMVHSIQEYNQYCLVHQKPPMAMGIGINTGPVMVGTVGGASKISPTVIGDAVNLASRLESVTKFYGVSIAISSYTYAQLENPDQFLVRWIGYIPIKGKSKSVLVYEIFDADDSELKEGKLATQQMFETGCLLYRQGNLARAAKLFRRCIKEVPRDQTAQTYLSLCQRIEPVLHSWGIG